MNHPERWIIGRVAAAIAGIEAGVDGVIARHIADGVIRDKRATKRPGAPDFRDVLTGGGIRPRPDAAEGNHPNVAAGGQRGREQAQRRDVNIPARIDRGTRIADRTQLRVPAGTEIAR